MKPRFDALAWTRGRTTVLVWLWLTCCVVGKVAFGDRTIPSTRTPGMDVPARPPEHPVGRAGSRNSRPQTGPARRAGRG
jgi:hypothetical protein